MNLRNIYAYECIYVYLGEMKNEFSPKAFNDYMNLKFTLITNVT